MVNCLSKTKVGYDKKWLTACLKTKVHGYDKKMVNCLSKTKVAYNKKWLTACLKQKLVTIKNG